MKQVKYIIEISLTPQISPNSCMAHYWQIIMITNEQNKITVKDGWSEKLYQAFEDAYEQAELLA